MKTDRELLELAARAAGLPMVGKWCADGYELPSHDPVFDPVIWNPLTDDGDALRLLVAMPSLWALKKMFGGPTIEMDVAWGTGRGIVVGEFFGDGADKNAAARRAIVRAAAEIGRAMP